MKRRRRTQKELDEAWAERCWRTAFLNEHPRCMMGPVLAAAGLSQARACRGWAVEVHERQKRSRLGSTTDPANTLSICRPCHDFTEREVTICEDLGLLVHSWDRPELIPLGPR